MADVTDVLSALEGTLRVGVRVRLRARRDLVGTVVEPGARASRRTVFVHWDEIGTGPYAYGPHQLILVEDDS